MAESVHTRPSLLVRLRDPKDQDAWRAFLDLYAPLIYGFGRKSGLQDADAADLTQLVLQAVSGSIGRLDYDRARGTFRGWLFGVTRNQLGKWRRGQKQPQGAGDTENVERLAALPAPDEADWWETEYKRQRFLVAAQRVRPNVNPDSWQAFWQTAVENRDAVAVAKELNLKVGALYTAKSRVLALIKREIETLEED
ncbi:MAG: sigma-70 family RNA polymerase sigma factor [Gemmataceae bacterium]